MKVVEGNFVRIDFGIEQNSERVKFQYGALYQNMKGTVAKFDEYNTIPRIILNKECSKKIEEYNLRTGNGWRKDPRIPFRFLFLFPSSNMLKNE